MQNYKYKYQAAAGEVMLADTAVWWDITSCPIPEGYDARLVRPSMELRLRKSGYSGPVTITALGNLKDIPDEVLQAYSSTGIVLKHDPFIESTYSERGAESFIAVELFGWKLRNPPPASVVFISDPQNFSRLAQPMNTIDMNGYNILYISKDTLKPPVRIWSWKILLQAIMGKAIQEEEKLDGSKVKTVGIVCRLCHIPPFDNLTAHLKSEMHNMTMSARTIQHVTMGDPKEKNEMKEEKEKEENKRKRKSNKKKKLKDKYQAAPVELLLAKTAVWWDITRCPIPEGYDARLVRPSIISRLKKSGYSGPVTITALGNLKDIPDEVLQAYSSTGIVLKHDPFIESTYSERGAVSFIAVELFCWKLQNPPPASVVFISDPQNFSRLALPMHVLDMRGYNILLISKDTFEPPIRTWSWKSFLQEAIMGKAIQEEEKLDDSKVKTVGIVCRVCHIPPFDNLTAHLKSEMHNMALSARTIRDVTMGDPKKKNEIMEEEEEEEHKRKSKKKKLNETKEEEKEKNNNKNKNLNETKEEEKEKKKKKKKKREEQEQEEQEVERASQPRLGKRKALHMP